MFPSVVVCPQTFQGAIPPFSAALAAVILAATGAEASTSCVKSLTKTSLVREDVRVIMVRAPPQSTQMPLYLAERIARNDASATVCAGRC